MFISVASDREPAGDVFPALYLIRMRGCLEGTGWSDWFGPMQMPVDVNQGETFLRGPVADQAELYGILSKLRNLTFSLLLVQKSESTGAECIGTVVVGV